MSIIAKTKIYFLGLPRTLVLTSSNRNQTHERVLLLSLVNSEKFIFLRFNLNLKNEKMFSDASHRRLHCVN